MARHRKCVALFESALRYHSNKHDRNNDELPLDQTRAAAFPDAAANRQPALALRSRRRTARETHEKTL
jgi:hypothetical protein